MEKKGKPGPEESKRPDKVLEYYRIYSQNNKLSNYLIGTFDIDMHQANTQGPGRLDAGDFTRRNFAVPPVIVEDADKNREPSPTSSVASNRKLEWDNGADIGYGNCGKRTIHKSASLPILTNYEIRTQYKSPSGDSSPNITQEIKDDSSSSSEVKKSPVYLSSSSSSNVVQNDDKAISTSTSEPLKKSPQSFSPSSDSDGANAEEVLHFIRSKVGEPAAESTPYDRKTVIYEVVVPDLLPAKSSSTGSIPGTSNEDNILKPTYSFMSRDIEEGQKFHGELYTPKMSTDGKQRSVQNILALIENAEHAVLSEKVSSKYSSPVDNDERIQMKPWSASNLKDKLKEEPVKHKELVEDSVGTSNLKNKKFEDLAGTSNLKTKKSMEVSSSSNLKCKGLKRGASNFKDKLMEDSGENLHIKDKSSKDGSSGIKGKGLKQDLVYASYVNKDKKLMEDSAESLHLKDKSSKDGSSGIKGKALKQDLVYASYISKDKKLMEDSPESLHLKDTKFKDGCSDVKGKGLKQDLAYANKDKKLKEDTVATSNLKECSCSSNVAYIKLKQDLTSNLKETTCSSNPESKKSKQDQAGTSNVDIQMLKAGTSNLPKEDWHKEGQSSATNLDIKKSTKNLSTSSFRFEVVPANANEIFDFEDRSDVSDDFKSHSNSRITASLKSESQSSLKKSVSLEEESRSLNGKTRRDKVQSSSLENIATLKPHSRKAESSSLEDLAIHRRTKHLNRCAAKKIRNLSLTKPVCVECFSSSFHEDKIVQTSSDNISIGVQTDSRRSDKKQGVLYMFHPYSKRYNNSDSTTQTDSDVVFSNCNSFEFMNGSACDKNSRKSSDCTEKSVEELLSQKLKRSAVKTDLTNLNTDKSTSSKENYLSDLLANEKLYEDIGSKLELLQKLNKSKKYDDETKKYYVKKILKSILKNNCSEDSSVHSERITPKIAVPYRERYKRDVYENSNTNSSHTTRENRLRNNVPWVPIAPNNDGIHTVEMGAKTEQPRKVRDARFTLPHGNVEYHGAQKPSTTESSSGTLNKPEFLLPKNRRTSYESWKENKTLSERLLEHYSDLTSGESRSSPNEQLVGFAKKERETQINWINNEINHLTKLKGLLEDKRKDRVSKISVEKVRNVKKSTAIYMITTEKPGDTMIETSKCNDDGGPVSHMEGGDCSAVKFRLRTAKGIRDYRVNEVKTQSMYDRLTKENVGNGDDLDRLSKENVGSDGDLKSPEMIDPLTKEDVRNDEVQESTRTGSENTVEDRSKHREGKGASNLTFRPKKIKSPSPENVPPLQKKVQPAKQPNAPASKDKPLHVDLDNAVVIASESSGGVRRLILEVPLEESNSNLMEQCEGASNITFRPKQIQSSSENVPPLQKKVQPARQPSTPASKDKPRHVDLDNAVVIASESSAGVRRLILEVPLEGSNSNVMEQCEVEHHKEVQTSKSLLDISSGSSTSSSSCVSSTESSEVICSCCRKRMAASETTLGYNSEVLNDVSLPAFCEPCFNESKKRPWNPECPFYAEPQHKCNCYNASAMDKIRSTLKELHELEARENYCKCQCRKMKGEASCHCKKKTHKKKPVAYLLTFEPGDFEVTSASSKDRSLEEIRIKIPELREKRKKLSAGDVEEKKKDEKEEKHKKHKHDKRKSKKSLQDYLETNNPSFVRGAEDRRKCMVELAYMREQRCQKYKQLLALTNGIPMHDLYYSEMHQKRLFTSKQMKSMTAKKYIQLPEVQQKLVENRNNDIKKANRLLADIFNKKLRERVLRGNPTISASTSVINLM